MREIRVWIEDGTLLGYAEIEAGGSFRVVVQDAPEESGYANWDYGFGTRAEAESYAREWAKGLAEWAQETCGSGDEDCGVLEPHGVSVQEVE